MLVHAPDPAISFPHTAAPDPGRVVHIAPGILWLRFWLPFLLNHVNVYLIEDGDGWAAVDTGIGIDDTKAAWDALFAGPLHGKKLTRVIATHHHPDHIGLVGWLEQRFGMNLHMPRTEFLFSLAITNSAFAANRPFFKERGLPDAATERVTTMGIGYLRLVTGLPTQIQRLVHGQVLRIGGRDFQVLTGGGHSPEQAMLYCASDKIFLSADQVMTKISPNISAPAMEPDSDPLGEYLASLGSLHGIVAEDTLVLPGHHLPFLGLGARVGELAAHHAGRCAMIADACREAPKTATDLLPTVFKRELDPHQMSFAFGEVVAHVNYMRGRGELVQFRDTDGILRVSTV